MFGTEKKGGQGRKGNRQKGEKEGREMKGKKGKGREERKSGGEGREEEWREELFIVLWEQLRIERTGRLFDRMAEIAEKKYNKKMLFILKEALDEVAYENLQVRACISEAVIGRKALSERSGMIFGAYDIGEKDLAKDFLQFVLNLLSDCTLTQKMLPRFERSITN